MKTNLNFLRPRLINILLAFVILYLPFLREQYKGGEYITWHRPFDLLIQYLQNLQNKSYFPLFIAVIVFSLAVYLLISALLFTLKTVFLKGKIFF